MARILEGEFGVKVRWVEDRAGTTWANARFSADMLRADGIDTVFVVTHAWHMRRALLAFRRFGLTAVPAPTHLIQPFSPGPAWFVPEASGWASSAFALHEWLGLAWYSIRGQN